MEGKLILYIAMSLDGYIAGPDGGVRFLEETPGPSPDLGYEEFYGSLQAVIMGGTTYRQIKNEPSPGKWPYKGCPATSAPAGRVRTTRMPGLPLCRQGGCWSWFSKNTQGISGLWAAGKPSAGSWKKT